MSRVGRWVCAGLVLGAAAVGCGGKDESKGTTSTAGSSSTAGKSSGSSGSTTVGGSAPTGMQTPAQVCADSCKTQAQCLPDVAESTCVSNCSQVSRVFTSQCADLQYAEYACIIDLTCTELEVYLDDKLVDPMCGSTYMDFSSTCLRGGTMPPQACVDFCEKTAECRPDPRGVNGCAQTCNELLTGYQIAGGEDCAAAFEDAFACFGSLECSGIDQIFEQQITPAQCAQHDQAVTTACR